MKPAQRPQNPDNWLYRDMADTRVFAKYVYLGRNDTPWEECTNEDKTKWEEEHKKEEEENENF